VYFGGLLQTSIEVVRDALEGQRRRHNLHQNGTIMVSLKTFVNGAKAPAVKTRMSMPSR
jgi:hypothetical protein